nr:N-6 DNA methylase [Psychroflexus torquis]
MPKSIVNLIAEMIEPYQGIIYDSACGSGGMCDVYRATLR